MRLRLSFDDGPHPGGTDEVSRLMAEHGVKATFFVWGEQAVEHPQTVRELIRAGHSVQPHCWEHRSHWDMSAEEIAADIDRVLVLLGELGATDLRLWRPPWGHLRSGATRAIARERGLELAGWTIDSTDYDATSAAVMYEIVTEGIASLGASEAVLLMHDGCLEPRQFAKRTDVGETVELLRLLLANDWTFAPLRDAPASGLDEQAERPS